MREHESETGDRRVAWWLFAIIGGGVLLVILYAGYGKVLSDRVETRLAALRAQGFPTTLGELDEWYPAPPLGKNAAVVYRRAFAKFTPREKTDKELPVVGEADFPEFGKPLPHGVRELIAAYLAENKEGIALLHDAAAVKESRYPIDMSMGIATLLPHLTPLRRGARLLQLDTIYSVETGNMDRAVDSMAASLGVGRSLAKEPLPISHLVRIACNAISCKGLRYALSRAAFTDEQLARLATAFSAAEDRDGMVRAFAGELCTGVDVISDPSRFGPGAPGAGGFQPLFLFRATGLSDVDLRHYVDAMQGAIAAAQRPPWEGLGAAKTFNDGVKDIPKYCTFSRMLLPALSYALIQDARNKAMLRSATTAIAIERRRGAQRIRRVQHRAGREGQRRQGTRSPHTHECSGAPGMGRDVRGGEGVAHLVQPPPLRPARPGAQTELPAA